MVDHTRHYSVMLSNKVIPTGLNLKEVMVFIEIFNVLIFKLLYHLGNISSGAWGQGPEARSRESGAGARSLKPGAGAKSQGPVARSWELGARSLGLAPGACGQELGARSQEPVARSQEPGARSQGPVARSWEPAAKS